MSYLPDLTPTETVFPKFPRGLLAVGWLGEGVPYSKGLVTVGFFRKIAKLLVHPWPPISISKQQRCPLCRFTGGPTEIVFGDCVVPLASVYDRYVLIPGSDCVFVVPGAIAHYMDAHEYCPPDLFQAAVWDCPEMGSSAYLDAIRNTGFDYIVQAGSEYAAVSQLAGSEFSNHTELARHDC